MPWLGVEGEAALDEAGDGGGSLVGVQLAVGAVGCGRRPGSAPTRSRRAPFLGAGRVAVAGDGVAGPAEADEALACRCAADHPGTATRTRRGCSRGSSGGREIPARRSVRQTVACAMAGLARDQPRPPPVRRLTAQIRSCSLAGNSRGQRCGRDERSSRQASDASLLKRRLPTSAATTYTPSSATHPDAAPPPDTNTPPPHQRPAPAGRKSEPSVTVKPHPGPPSSCEPWQTHSLEGGPDGLPNRPQPIEARHLDPVNTGGIPAPACGSRCRSTPGAARPRPRRLRADGELDGDALIAAAHRLAPPQAVDDGLVTPGTRTRSRLRPCACPADRPRCVRCHTDP